ncbi:hypothetical protein D3C71_2134560 [compost metagenome]
MQRSVASCDRIIDCGEQHLIAERLGQEIERAGLHCLDGAGDIAIASDENNWHVESFLGNP